MLSTTLRIILAVALALPAAATHDTHAPVAPAMCAYGTAMHHPCECRATWTAPVNGTVTHPPALPSRICEPGMLCTSAGECVPVPPPICPHHMVAAFACTCHVTGPETTSSQVCDPGMSCSVHDGCRYNVAPPSSECEAFVNSVRWPISSPDSVRHFLESHTCVQNGQVQCGNEECAKARRYLSAAAAESGRLGCGLVKRLTARLDLECHQGIPSGGVAGIEHKLQELALLVDPSHSPMSSFLGPDSRQNLDRLLAFCNDPLLRHGITLLKPLIADHADIPAMGPTGFPQLPHIPSTQLHSMERNIRLAEDACALRHDVRRSGAAAPTPIPSDADQGLCFPSFVEFMARRDAEGHDAAGAQGLTDDYLLDICRTDDGARAKCVQRMLVGHNVFVADPHAPVPGTGAHGVVPVHEREALSDLMCLRNNNRSCLVELSETNHPLDNACGACSVSGAADYDACVHDLGGHWEVKDPSTDDACNDQLQTYRSLGCCIESILSSPMVPSPTEAAQIRAAFQSARPPVEVPAACSLDEFLVRGELELDVSEARCRAFKDLIQIDVAAAAGVRRERVVDLQCRAPPAGSAPGAGRRLAADGNATTAPAAPQSAWACDASVNYVPGMAYTQHTIDSMYSAGQTTFDEALERCKALCEARSSCSGFFYQQHVTTHQICGLFSAPLAPGFAATAHGHLHGAVCQRALWDRGRSVVGFSLGVAEESDAAGVVGALAGASLGHTNASADAHGFEVHALDARVVGVERNPHPSGTPVFNPVEPQTVDADEGCGSLGELAGCAGAWLGEGRNLGIVVGVAGALLLLLAASVGTRRCRKKRAETKKGAKVQEMAAFPVRAVVMAGADLPALGGVPVVVARGVPPEPAPTDAQGRQQGGGSIV